MTDPQTSDMHQI